MSGVGVELTRFGVSFFLEDNAWKEGTGDGDLLGDAEHVAAGDEFLPRVPLHVS